MALSSKVASALEELGSGNRWSMGFDVVANEERSSCMSASVSTFCGGGASVVGSEEVGAGAASVGISSFGSDGFADPDEFWELQSHPILICCVTGRRKSRKGIRGKRGRRNLPLAHSKLAWGLPL